MTAAMASADPDARLKQGTPTTRASKDFALSVAWIGATPFWLAAKFADVDIMRALVPGGADPRLTLPNGNDVADGGDRLWPEGSRG